MESLKKQVQELIEENKKLKGLQAIQGDLFDMIIHDLKGPLGETMANLDLLKYDRSLSEESQEYLETAFLGCENIFRMVLNILDIRKIEEGRMNLNKNNFKIEDLIQEKVGKVKAMAKQNEIRFVMDIKKGLKEVRADKEIIERVLSNLMQNAIAFSFPDSDIKIIAEKNEDKDFLKVSISDQGKGIPEEYINKIFDKYSQETESQERRQYSTGLGLTFCKMAIEAHNGKIWVESKEGEGSTFSFTIPINRL